MVHKIAAGKVYIPHMTIYALAK